MKRSSHTTKLALAAVMAILSFHAFAAGPKPDPNKVLRYQIPVAETGFDPATVNDLYSNYINDAIFESLVTYDYLARPSKLVPRAAEALPEMSEGGKVYTFKVKKGIYYADDPAFNGQKRELTAQDFAFQIRRMADPKLHSQWRYLVEGKILGITEAIKAAEKSGKFDYATPIAGIETPDRYTLRITLVDPDFNYPYIMATPQFVGIAHEVVAKYGTDLTAHPVGTGPYIIDKWVRSSMIELTPNPNYRGHVWDFKAQEPGDEQLVKEMKGKMLPTIGRVTIAVMEEDQARLLAFQNKELDLFQLEGPLAPRVMNGKVLNDDFIKRGAKLTRIIDPELQYPYLSSRDPITGGMSKEKVALRRAIFMAYDDEEEIRVVHSGQAEQIEYPVPPGVVGHLPGYRRTDTTNPRLANALLDKFGYKVGSDGFRTLPNGKPLAIRLTSRPDTLGRHQEEMWQKTFNSIKIRMESDKRKFPEILKAEKQCQLQMRVNRWIADFPDGDNFMQLFYSKNVGQSNNSCTDLPEFDRLYEKARVLPAGEERDKLYVDMARLLEYSGAVRISMARARNMVMQKHVIGYKKHPIILADWIYADIDNSLKDTP